MKTIYNVYEANRLSETVPGVGKNVVSIDIPHADGKMQSLSQSGYKELNRLYGKFGPREIKKEIEFNPDFLESF
jgi:hypothetical protein